METDLYQSLVSLLSNMLEAYTTAFFILDAKSRKLNMVASQSLSRHLSEGISLPLDQSGILAQAQKVGQTIHLDKIKESTSSLLSTVPFYREGESHIKGLFVAPVVEGAGVLYVDTKHGWGFNDKQQKLILEMAEVLGRLLLGQAGQARQQNCTSIIEFWQRVDQGASGMKALPDFCQLIVNESTRYLGAEYGFFALMEEGESHYQMIAATPNVPRSIAGQRLQPKQGLVGWILQNRKPLLVPRLNPQNSDHYLFFPSEGLPHHGAFWGLTAQMGLGHSMVIAFLSRRSVEWNSDKQFGIAHVMEFARLLLEQCCYREECQQLQTYDVSTGLYNPLAFESRLEGIMEASMQGSSPLTLALVQFEPWQVLSSKISPKQVRQLQAHLTGAVCKALPPGVLLGQMAENRFALLFPGTSPDEAESFITKTCDSAKRAFSGKVRGMRIHPYKGSVGFPEDGARSDELWTILYGRLYDAFSAKTDKPGT